MRGPPVSPEEDRAMEASKGYVWRDGAWREMDPVIAEQVGAESISSDALHLTKQATRRLENGDPARAASYLRGALVLLTGRVA